MSGPQAGTLAVLLAGVITAPVLVMAGIAWLAGLWFQSRIEAVRADAVTAVLDGRLGQDHVVSTYLAALDWLARDARWPAVRLIAQALAGDDNHKAGDS